MYELLFEIPRIFSAFSSSTFLQSYFCIDESLELISLHYFPAEIFDIKFALLVVFQMFLYLCHFCIKFTVMS